MKQILFRGKHIHTLSPNEPLDGTWIEGYLADETDIHSPELEGEFLVDPKTVCQYTGLTDKNGRKIFEGDIVRIDGQEELFTVVWVCDTARFGLQSKTQLLYFEFGLGSRIEVIGNIHENADLLKE